MRDTPPLDNELRPELRSGLADLIMRCDSDVLARRLGLRSSSAAMRLRTSSAAMHHLVTRLMEGCDGLSNDEALGASAQLLQIAPGGIIPQNEGPRDV